MLGSNARFYAARNEEIYTPEDALSIIEESNRIIDGRDLTGDLVQDMLRREDAHGAIEYARWRHAAMTRAVPLVYTMHPDADAACFRLPKHIMKRLNRMEAARSIHILAFMEDRDAYMNATDTQYLDSIRIQCDMESMGHFGSVPRALEHMRWLVKVANGAPEDPPSELMGHMYGPEFTALCDWLVEFKALNVQPPVGTAVPTVIVHPDDTFSIAQRSSSAAMHPSIYCRYESRRA